MIRTIPQECLECKETFEVSVKEVNRGNGKFCSLKCSAVFNGRKRAATKKSNVTCANCSKEFYKSASKLKKSKSGLFFCSRACKDSAQRLDGLKELHLPHYGNGKSSYRIIAFRLLPNKCSTCGYDKHPEVLQVHHKDRNRENNSIENLEILCPTCHEVEHFLSGDGRFSGGP